MMKKLITILTTSFLLSFGSVHAADDFNAAWEAADQKRKDAAAAGYEWRDTKKILKKAKKTHEDGDTEKAMKMVARAHEQSEDALAQKLREASLWQARVPQ